MDRRLACGEGHEVAWVRMNSFFRELKQRRVYRVAIGYAIAAWLAIQIAATVLPAFHASEFVLPILIVLLGIGFPVALVLAWAFDVTPSGIEKAPEGTRAVAARNTRNGWMLAGFGIAIAALVVVGYFWHSHGGTRAVGSNAASRDVADEKTTDATARVPPVKSIAVLPFVDMSQAKDQEYFCDGISEEILDTLAQVEGLRVVARTSSFSFKGKNTDVGEVARKLNVENVLEGSLRRAGNRIRITAQLINARDGFHLWSETYERELQDVFAVQDEITRSIVDALKIKLAVAPTLPASHNTEAHDLYLQGLFFSNKSDEQNLRKALDLFQRAIDKDPGSSRAWAGIAKVWDWLADAYVKPLDAYPLVKAAATKAISLDERNAEAHCWLGDAIHVLDWDIAGYEREVKRALEIDPNSAVAHLSSGMLRRHKGDWQGAIAEAEEAMKLDPLSPVGASFPVISYLRSGQLDKAIAAAHRVSELDPNYLYREPSLAIIYRESGRYDEAVAVYTKAQQVTHSPNAGLAVTYAQMGRKEDARRILNQILEEARTRYVPGVEIASIYAALGERKETFGWLERAYAEHDWTLSLIKFDPVFRSLQSDPRFADLLRRIGQ